MGESFYLSLAILACIAGYYLWRFRRRRPAGDGYRFVYVNQDGTAREVTDEEREYLERDYEGGDGDRPYLKSRYETKDGWGSLSGFIERVNVPREVTIAGVDAAYKAGHFDWQADSIEDALAVGDRVTRHPEGSVTIEPNREVDAKERFRILAQCQLRRQREREARVSGRKS